MYGAPNLVRLSIPTAGKYIAFPSISVALSLIPATGVVRLYGNSVDFAADTSPVAGTFSYAGESILELASATSDSFHSWHWASNGVWLRAVGSASNIVLISYHQ